MPMRIQCSAWALIERLSAPLASRRFSCMSSEIVTMPMFLPWTKRIRIVYVAYPSSRRAAGAIPSIVAGQHLQQLDLEDQVGIGRNAPDGAFAVAQVCRHEQLAPAAHAHAHQALVPALDDPPGADHAAVGAAR